MNANAPTPSLATRPTATITREAAHALLDAARLAAREMGIEVAIAVTDAAGHLTAFERADTAPYLTAEVAIDKAWSAASFGLSTLTWNAVIENRQVTPLAYRPRMVAVGGGYPILVNGQVVGGIGISGGNAQQDHDLCEQALRQMGFELR